MIALCTFATWIKHRLLSSVSQRCTHSQNKLFSVPWWHQALSLAVVTTVKKKRYGIKMLTNGPFVNFVACCICSVTKQLLEPAPWACFLFRLVISCLHASGPWATRPPMMGAPSRNLFLIATEERFPKSIFCLNEVYWHR